MKSAAKEKIRSSGPTRSYLQTRIRGQRLLNAARILALIELSRRLHQAYRYAYDKQAAGWLLPQEPTPTPTPCPGSIPEAAAMQILAIAAQEGVDPTLLSVTWRHESSFTSDPPPNPRCEGRGRNRRIVGWDVGPMQTATNVWNKAPFTDGLSDPFGAIAMSRITRQYVGFNGSVSDNLTLGARAFSMDILNRSRSLADAAGLYRAGSRTGPGYQQPYNEYTSEPWGQSAVELLGEQKVKLTHGCHFRSCS